MTAGSIIQVLPDRVANKIAAGEVVERPASVVKELTENSIDAGAQRITIELVDGGRKLISIRDDGRGMVRDDAILAIERHATSKIRDVDDIESVSTMGFRGEALAAISSVSRFTLTTRTPDAHVATCVEVNGGLLHDVREVGAPPGTLIEVRNIFCNVPARRKFLRTAVTETNHVRQQFIQLALTHPKCGWRLVLDGREAWDLPPGANLEERVRSLFGTDTFQGLTRVSGQYAQVQISGLMGLPRLSRTDRSQQYFGINGRPATCPILQYALREGYRGVLPKGRHPVVFLSVELDPGDVDVNVHPTKREVRFRRPGDVRDALIQVLREGLMGSGTELNPSANLPRIPVAPHQQPALNIEPEPGWSRPEERHANPVAIPEPVQEGPASGGVAPPPVAPEATPFDHPESPWSWCKLMGAAGGGRYAVFETEDGLVLMDPRAAHERILYEALLKVRSGAAIASQGLLVPETVELSARDAAVLGKHLEALQGMGFSIEGFGADSFLVEALPAVLGDVSASALLPDIAAVLSTTGRRRSKDRWIEEQVAVAASQRAVSRSTKRTDQELQHLIEKLVQCDMPYTDPQGRPTLIFMGFSELNRKFGRA